MIAYLGMGTNIGDREDNLREALRRLSASGEVIAVASLYETEPVGYSDQAAFLNTAIALKTALPPLDLLGQLKQIERAMGRQESFRNAPRVIDLDIELYGSSAYAHERLTIPHLRLAERRFVLAPLAEIAGDVRHPLLHKTVSELLAETDDTAAVTLSQPQGWQS